MGFKNDNDITVYQHPLRPTFFQGQIRNNNITISAHARAIFGMLMMMMMMVMTMTMTMMMMMIHNYDDDDENVDGNGRRGGVPGGCSTIPETPAI